MPANLACSLTITITSTIPIPIPITIFNMRRIFGAQSLQNSVAVLNQVNTKSIVELSSKFKSSPTGGELWSSIAIFNYIQ